MKNLLMIGMLFSATVAMQAFDLSSVKNTVKIGQMCGDGCDGSCKPKPEVA